jgi:hypothetical protein
VKGGSRKSNLLEGSIGKVGLLEDGLGKVGLAGKGGGFKIGSPVKGGPGKVSLH